VSGLVSSGEMLAIMGARYNYKQLKKPEIF
jgi:hypothetical protein